MKRLALILALSMPAFGVVARLNTNTGVRAAGTSLSSAFTINAGGTNVVAFAVIGWDKINSLSVTATLGGNAMTASCTAVKNTDGTNFYYSQVFQLANPPTGSQTLAVTATAGTNEIYANVIVFQGVDQTNPVRSGTCNSAIPTGTTTPSVTITSNVSDLSLTVIHGGNGSGVGGTNQTSDGINNGGNFGFGSDHATTAAGSVTHNWTLLASGAPALSGFSICSSGSSCAGAVATCPHTLTLMGVGCP